MKKRSIPLPLIGALILGSMLVTSCGIEDYPYLYSFDALNGAAVYYQTNNSIEVTLPDVSVQPDYYTGFSVYYRLYPKKYSSDTATYTTDAKVTTDYSSIVNASALNIGTVLQTTYDYTVLRFRAINLTTGTVSGDYSNPLAGSFNNANKFTIHLTSPTEDTDFIPYASFVNTNTDEEQDYALIRSTEASNDNNGQPFLRIQDLPLDYLDNEVADIEVTSGTTLGEVDIQFFIVAIGLDGLDKVFSEAYRLGSYYDSSTSQYSLLIAP